METTGQGYCSILVWCLQCKEIQECYYNIVILCRAIDDDDDLIDTAADDFKL